MSGLISHGTYGGYQAHKRAGEQACDPCAEASRAYARHYRSGPKRKAVADAEARQRRYMRALRVLASRHPVEFARILDAQEVDA